MILKDYINLLTWIDTHFKMEGEDKRSSSFVLSESWAKKVEYNKLNPSSNEVILGYYLFEHYFYLENDGYRQLWISDEDALEILKEYFNYSE